MFFFTKFLFLIVLFSTSHCDDKNPCKFSLTSGEKIDLTRMMEMDVDLTPCGKKYHTLIVDVCHDLSEETCPSVDTSGPGNACDSWVSTTSKYLWIGGVSDWEKTTYDEKKKQFKMSYYGKLQAKVIPSWSRNLEVTAICDESMKGAHFKCMSIENQGFSTTYHLQITSGKVCPVASDKIAIVLTIIGIFCCLCCICPFLTTAGMMCFGTIVGSVLAIKKQMEQNKTIDTTNLVEEYDDYGSYQVGNNTTINVEPLIKVDPQADEESESTSATNGGKRD